MSVLTTASTLSPTRMICLASYLVCAHTLNRVIASRHFSDDRIVIVGVKPSAIPNLSAGLGVERRVIKDDLALLASLEFLHALPILHDGKHFAAVGARLPVAFEDRLGQLLICGVGGLLGRAFPGGASALALLVHGRIEAA